MVHDDYDWGGFDTGGEDNPGGRIQMKRYGGKGIQ